MFSTSDDKPICLSAGAGPSLVDKIHYFIEKENTFHSCSRSVLVEAHGSGINDTKTYFITAGHTSNAKDGKFYDQPDYSREIGCLKYFSLGNLDGIFSDVALVEANEDSGMMCSESLIYVADKNKGTRKIKLEVRPFKDIEDKYMNVNGGNGRVKQICKQSSDGVVYGTLNKGTLTIDAVKQKVRVFSANEPYKGCVTLPGQSGCSITEDPADSEDTDYINLIAIMGGRITIPSSTSANSSEVPVIEETAFITIVSREIIEKMESFLEQKKFNRKKYDLPLQHNTVAISSERTWIIDSGVSTMVSQTPTVSADHIETIYCK